MSTARMLRAVACPGAIWRAEGWEAAKTTARWQDKRAHIVRRLGGCFSWIFSRAAHIATLARNVRNGRPMGIAGLPEIAKSAAFSTVAGMLVYPQVCAQEYTEPRGSRRLTGTDGYLARVGNWLRHSF